MSSVVRFDDDDDADDDDDSLFTMLCSNDRVLLFYCYLSVLIDINVE